MSTTSPATWSDLGHLISPGLDCTGSSDLVLHQTYLGGSDFDFGEFQRLLGHLHFTHLPGHPVWQSERWGGVMRRSFGTGQTEPDRQAEKSYSKRCGYPPPA